MLGWNVCREWSLTVCFSVGGSKVDGKVGGCCRSLIETKNCDELAFAKERDDGKKVEVMTCRLCRKRLAVMDEKEGRMLLSFEIHACLGAVPCRNHGQTSRLFPNDE